MDKSILKKLKTSSVVILAVILLLEIFIFNYNRLTPQKRITIDPSDITIETPDTITLTDNGIEVTGYGIIIFHVNSSSVHGFELKNRIQDTGRYYMATFMTDENFSQSYIQISRKLISDNTSEIGVSFLNYEDVKDIKLEFYEVSQPFTIERISFVNHEAFHFSWLRVITLFVVAEIVNLICLFKVYSWEYDKKNRLQRNIIIAIFILSIGLLFCFKNPEAIATKYSETNYIDSDPFSQMFDSAQHGTLELLAEVDPSLETLDNPFDKSVRDAAGVNGFWDRSYYNGHYYSYFGITPVFIYYYPFYFFSGGYIPSLNTACLFFSILALIFLYETVFALLEKFSNKVNFLVLCLSLASISCMTGITQLLGRSYFYHIPPLCSTFLLALCIYAGVKGSSSSSIKKYIFLFISGLAFILCFESRLTKALSALILAPLFLEIIFNKKLTKKDKIISATSFLLPVFAGLALVLWKNYVRFDSIFEFGTNYQLTVNNINANTVTLRLLPATIYNYFLQPTGVRDYFPYIVPSLSSFATYGRYLYQYENLGILNYPWFLAGMLIASAYLINNWKNKELVVKKYFYILCFLLMLITAWLVECKAGTILYYTTEIMPLAFFISVLSINDFVTGIKDNKQLLRNTFIVLGGSFLISNIICLSHTMIYIDNILTIAHLDWVNYLEKIIFFWH